MADEPNVNMSSDRARRINSLHRTVDDLVHEQNKKRLQTSQEISALTKEQQRLMATLDAERGEFTSETAASYNTVVKSLGQTIQNLSIGVKNITLDTAKATSGAISQYGKAIGEDISINKQNTVAMALAKATPLFGYFAAKFMETDVFQSSAQKIKEKVSGTLASAGESLGNVFKKKQAEGLEGEPPKLQEGGYVKKGGIVEVHAAEVVTPIDKIMQKIDNAKSEDIAHRLSTVLNTLSQSMVRMETFVGTIQDDKKDMIATFIDEFKNAKNVQSKTNADRLLKAVLELKVGMIGTASRMRIAWQRTLLQHPTFRGMLMFGQTMQSAVTSPFKALFGLRGGFAGDVRRATRTSNVYKQQVNLLALIYSKGMTFLRNIEKYTKVSAEALVGEEVSPTSSKSYTLFGKVKEFMTSRSTQGLKEAAFDSFVSNLNLDKSALKEAGIESFTDLLSPVTALKNMMAGMGITKANIRGKVKEGPGGGNTYFDDAEEKLWNAKFDAEFKARGFAKRAGAKAAGMGDKFSAASEAAQNAKFDAEFAIRAKSTKFKSFISKLGIGDKYDAAKESASGIIDNVKSVPGRIIDELKRIREAEEDREDREGPHSPSMAENIAATAQTARDEFKHQHKTSKERQETLKDIKKSGRKSTSIMGRMRSGIKKMGKGILSWIPLVLGFLFRVVGGGIKSIVKGIWQIASWGLRPILLGMRKIISKGFGSVFGGIKNMFGKSAGSIPKNLAGTAGKVTGSLRGAAAKGGARGVVGLLGRGAAKGAGIVAGATGGLVIGGIMALGDAVEAIRNPEGFVGGIFTRGLAGFLGGSDTGASGMLGGAMKGGAIGAGLGSVVPGFGTAIGGAIGAAAGAILGFVGGKRISAAISNTMDGIKEIISSIWSVIKFPFQALKELAKSAYYLMEFGAKQIFTWLDEWLTGPGWIGSIWEAIKNFFGKISNWVSGLFAGGEWVERLKQGITDFIFPIPNLILGLKELGGMADEWISGLPVIGKIYKKVKGGVKSIRSGDMSESLKRALDGKPALLSEKQKEGMSAKEIAKIYAEDKTSQEKMAAEQRERLAKEKAAQGDKNTKALLQQSHQSTKTIVNSNQSYNTVNNVAPGDRIFKGRNSNTEHLLFASHQ